MRWSYKTVHFSLKKEGLLGSAFLDENELEISLNEYGRLGWELVSIQEVNDGLIAILKQPYTRGLLSVEDEPVVISNTENPLQRQVEVSSSVSSSSKASISRKKIDESVLSNESDVGSIRIM